MKKLILLLFVLPFLGIASDIFDKAADLYINGKLNESKRLIETALQANPGDEKLQKLLAMIEEEEQQQQQQQQQQQNEQQQSEEQKEEEQQEQQQQQQQQQQEEEQQAEEQQAEQQQAEQSEDEINKEEAERILNALKEDEQDAQKKKAPVKAQGRRAEKDW